MLCLQAIGTLISFTLTHLSPSGANKFLIVGFKDHSKDSTAPQSNPKLNLQSPIRSNMFSLRRRHLRLLTRLRPHHYSAEVLRV